MFTIRKATITDLDVIMNVYEHARNFMIRTGNPNQWGDSKPYKEWIEHDIEEGKCYVCVVKVITGESLHGMAAEEERIAAVFYFAVEEDPTYKRIYEGHWLSTKPYGVVHRIASAGIVKGAGEYCLKWAINQSGNLRIDTHEENTVMQRLLKKLDFQYCGIIHLENKEPRLAFQYEKVTY